MTASRETLNASMELVTFVTRYNQVLSKQLHAVQAMMAGTVETVMKSINDLSSATEVKKREAENALEQTYLSPDSDTVDLVKSIQNSVDDVFAAAAASISQGSAQQSQELEDHSVQLRRLGGQFSKHMESLSTLDDGVKAMLLSMMGALSADDVIRQRLEHIAMAISAMQVGLNYLLLDFDKRFNTSNVESFSKDLLDYTWRSYSMEEERDLFRRCYPSVKIKSAG